MIVSQCGVEFYFVLGRSANAAAPSAAAVLRGARLRGDVLHLQTTEGYQYIGLKVPARGASTCAGTPPALCSYPQCGT
eukprot:953338-Prymnesium_polylepis.1